MISESLISALPSGEYMALFCWFPRPSGGGNEVWRSGWEDDVALAIEGLRRGLGVPAGRARGPGRWRGRARDAGVGGEVAEGGGEAMVVVFVCAEARFP